MSEPLPEDDQEFDVGEPENRSFLSELLRHTPATVYMVTLDNRYLYVNRAWEEAFSVSASRALGRMIRELFPPATVQMFEGSNRQVVETGAPLTIEQLVETANGPRYFRTVKFPVRDAQGKIHAVAGMGIDITEKKNTEQALRLSEVRMRRFFEAAFEGIVIHENGIIRDINATAAAMHGYEIHEVLGRHILDFIAPESHDEVRSRVAARDERPYEVVGLRKDGSTFSMEGRGKNIASEGRTIRVACLRDVTERRRSEELLRQYAERKRALSQNLLQVQEKERQHLARELHDEIGQTLTGLQFTLDLGERLGETGLRDKVREARGLVRELTARVRELSLRLRPTMLDDLGLLPALHWLVERYTAQTGVRVDFQHRGLSRRFAPETEITAYRLVQEALTNVARHSGANEAGVRITLDGGTLRLEIEDRGAGFDPKEPAAPDAGCGLSGLRQRVGLLGGRFRLSSGRGMGTRLAVELLVDAGKGGEDDDSVGSAGR